MAASDRRSELAAFLRSRRARLRPEDVRLPPGGRRHTPGLRREEVAQLAGVGVTWYTWLEQGRPIHPSGSVLDAVARALRLDPSEHQHLRRLSGSYDAPDLPEDNCGGPALRRVVDALTPYPVNVLTSRYDSIGRNRAFDALFGDLDRLPPERRNILRLAFVEPRFRSLLKDWEREVGHIVAVFRAAMADRAGEQAWTSMVEELTAVSPEFVRMWARHEVAAPGPIVKDLLHPVVGPLRLESTSLWLADRPGVRMITYTPVDSASEAGLAALADVEPATDWSDISSGVG